MSFPSLQQPIVAAPMAGGPTTPALVAAVSEAGGLGFLAGGYATAGALAADVVELRRLTGRPFGVNLFVPSPPDVDVEALSAYRERLEPEAERRGVELGEPRWSDDGWEAKLESVLEARPAVVSFTFGSPPAADVARLHERAIGAWCTVTSPAEAALAAEAGADALVVQGVEAGGHRGSFVDADGEETFALLPLLRLVAGAVDLPLVAAGGIADGASVAAVLAAGARAAQIGTAFLLCPEAGTSDVHRRALAGDAPTAVTRAFTGRSARGIANAFQAGYAAAAPRGYPQVHYVTAPLRAQARQAGDASAVNLWAGQAYRLAEAAPAGDLVRRWSADARAALTKVRP